MALVEDGALLGSRQLDMGDSGKKEIERPAKELLEPFWDFGTATISSALREVSGIRRAFLIGPRPYTPGLKSVGVAITLQFLPKREDVEASQLEEETESRSALWDAIIAVGDGEVLVVDARGDVETGCLGEMLMTGIRAKGCKGLVVDGAVRDYPLAKEIGLPLFLKSKTPHNASHFNMYPWDYNIPIGCGGILIMPGDIIVGDDDGVVVVPPNVAPEVIEYCERREAGEVFERIMLKKTGLVEKYYPMNEEAQQEYEEWKKTGKIPSKYL